MHNAMISMYKKVKHSITEGVQLSLPEICSLVSEKYSDVALSYKNKSYIKTVIYQLLNNGEIVKLTDKPRSYIKLKQVKS